MNKMIKKATALALAGTMLLSTNVFAADPLTINYALKAPTLEVAVPVDMDFTIDPMKINATESGGHQIYSSPYLFVNKSNVPVEIGAKVTITPTTATTNKPIVKTEDDVLAASAEITKLDRFFSLYVAPITKSKLNSDGETLNTTTPADNEFAAPTSYIGIGTTGATFNTVLDVSNEYDLDLDTWAAPTTTQLTDGSTFDAFKFVGSVNKNATWGAEDIKVGITYSFVGMPTDDLANYNQLSSYQNITKFTEGTGATVATPRFRSKIEKVTSAAPLPLTLELGSTAAAYVKTLADGSKAAAFTVSAVTVKKNGVLDATTPIKATATNMPIVVSTTAEAGRIATITIPAADITALQNDSTYEITSITLKQSGTGTLTYITGLNAGTTINKAFQ